jgi:hypothetical protein
MVTLGMQSSTSTWKNGYANWSNGLLHRDLMKVKDEFFKKQLFVFIKF